jgi:hypothetical protein
MTIISVIIVESKLAYLYSFFDNFYRILNLFEIQSFLNMKN